MNRQPLDYYDELPKAMVNYLRHYGYHFNRKAYEYAVENMKSRSGEDMQPISKENFEAEMKKYGIELENDIMCDGMYVYCMAKSDCYQSSLPTDQHIAMHVKDVIDDIDAPDGAVFAKWYACMVRAGQPIDWEDLL